MEQVHLRLVVQSRQPIAGVIKMFLISQVTADATQNMTLILPNGNPVSLTLYWIPQQYGWFILNLTYGSFVLNGLRICNSPNMLSQFQNQIPFGLACYTAQNREPSQQNDFVSGASLLYILSAEEVEEVQAIYQTGSVE